MADRTSIGLPWSALPWSAARTAVAGTLLALAAATPARPLHGQGPTDAGARVGVDGARPAIGPSSGPAADTGRVRAVTYSEGYERRLTIHRIGSYAILPLFAGQYVLGERLLSSSPQPSWVRPTHVGVAYATAAVFTANTVTGVWNAWEARRDPSGRTRRLVHTALMLAADAGFAYTGTLGDDASSSVDGRRRHRAAALTSIGVSTAGAAMMWLWKD